VFLIRLPDCRRLEYLLFGRWVLLDVGIDECTRFEYHGRGKYLCLKDGRRIRLFGVRLDDFAELRKVIAALNSPPCGLSV
jgi:hypothetical protein